MKEKSKQFKVKLALIIVVVLAVGAVASAKMIPVVRKAMMSTTEYYQHVEKANRDEAAELLSGYYDKVYKSYDCGDSYGRSVDMKLKLSDTAKSLLSLSGVDASKMDNIALAVNSSKEKKAYSGTIKLGVNDNDLVTLKTYLDTEQKKEYMQIPELTKSYLDLSSALRDENTMGVTLSMLSLADMSTELPKTADLVKIYNRYTDILIDSAKNVTKKEGGCEAEGILQTTDKYTVTWKAKEADALYEKLLKELKKDGEIKKLISKMGDDSYTSFTNSLDDMLKENKKDASSDGILTMETHITDDEKIVGRTITIKDSKDKAVVDILYPQDGEKFGFTFKVTVNGTEYVDFYGKGTLKNGVLNGEFALDAGESLKDEITDLATTENLLKVKIKDYDLSKILKGKASGTITYSSEATSELANYSLRVSAKGDIEKSTSKLEVLAGKETFVTIDMTMKNHADVESTKPSEDAKIYDVTDSSEMLQYQMEMDTIGLLQKVQDTTGIDLSSLLYGGIID